jgi:predicted RNase H-like HicB family nuclease
MNLHIEFDREEDGRWIAEIPQMPGVMVYGATKAEAEARVQALALRVVAEQLEKDDTPIDHVGFAAA